MTKEQVNYHKEVIKYFLDNPDEGVWYKSAKKYHTNMNFQQYTKEPNFFIDEIYIQNDEYVEFRKALADGKNIQYYVDGFVGWKDTTHFNNHPMKELCNYRIKPTNFKIGDWVI